MKISHKLDKNSQNILTLKLGGLYMHTSFHLMDFTDISTVK